MENFVEGLGISVICILVVFATLLLLSFLINVLKSILGPKKKEKSLQQVQTTLKSPSTLAGNDDEELAAVIAAAITAYEESK